jgi:hypothetical protein
MILISFSIEKSIIPCLYSAFLVPHNLLYTRWISSIILKLPIHCLKWLWPKQVSHVSCVESHVSFPLRTSCQRIRQSPGSLWMVCNMARFRVRIFNTSPLKLEKHPLSSVRDCLFNVFSATLHIGCRSSIRNLRTRHAVVTGTHL